MFLSLLILKYACQYPLTYTGQYMVVSRHQTENNKVLFGPVRCQKWLLSQHTAVDSVTTALVLRKYSLLSIIHSGFAGRSILD